MSKRFKKEMQKAVKFLHPDVMDVSRAMDAVTQACNKQGFVVDWKEGKVFDAPEDSKVLTKTMDMTPLRKIISNYKKTQART